MASLTQTAYVTRNLIKYGGAGIIALIVLQWGISTAITAYLKAHPPYVPPTVRYGKISKIVFPTKETKSITFTKELPNDAFPKVSDQAKVYVVYRPVNSLLALDEDTKTAVALGFTSQGVETNTGIYQWTNQLTSQVLTINVLDGSFEMKYPYENDQLLQNPEKMPSNQEAISLAKNYLQQANKLSTDLEQGEIKVSYWTIGFGGLKSVTSLSEANAIRVDMFRQSTDDGFKILPSDPKKASVSFLISGATVESKKIIQANYQYAPIDRQSYSTYPIKTPEEAWTDFQKGMYWPAQGGTQNTTIRKIYLAYFEPATLTNFMQPIYVFEGDNDFVGYLPAVADSMISSGL